MMQRGYNPGFPVRGGFGRRGRGFRGGGSHIHDSPNPVLALQIAESHQCNNLSFETRDPATKDSRIYVGNLCKKKVHRPDVYIIFSKYGTITAISHLSSRNPRDSCAFAFVQYTTRDAAEKAVLSENGHGYYGYTLDVKLAEFNASSQNQDKAPLSRESSTSQSGPLFNKRAATNGLDSSTPVAKKARIEKGNPPDILVCGTCHGVFNGIEAMIVHKREPCKSVKKCRCDEEDIPDVVSCAICFKKLATPWQLIVHTHNVHNIQICNDMQAVELAAASQVADEIGEEEYEDVVEEGFDLENLDNDLMDEEH